MKRTALASFLALWLMALAVDPFVADTRIRGRYTSAGQASESVVYSKGLRQRYEYATDMAVIEQLDLKRRIQLNRQTKTYLIIPTDKRGSPAVVPQNDLHATAESRPAPEGIVTQTSTRNDTGERRDAFGFSARRIKSIITRVPQPDACTTATEKMEVDGWYIDLDESSTQPGEELQGPDNDEACHDRVLYEEKGEARRGYPIYYTIRIVREESGVSATTEITMEVLELNVTMLDDALFEIPAGYAEAKTYEDFTRLYSSLINQAPASSQGAAHGTTPATGQGLPGLGSAAGAVGGVSGSSLSARPEGGRYIGTKPKGFVRIGVPAVVNKTKWQVPTTAYADHLILFIDSERKKKVEAVPLDGATAAAQESDARAKECNFVMQVEIADLHRELPKVKKGMAAMSAMGGAFMPGVGKYEAKLDYKLLAVGQKPPKLSSSVVSQSGKGNSGWKTALNIGLTAGSMALASQGMGGFGPGMMGMFRMSPNLGAFGLGRAMQFDPRVMGLSGMLGNTLGSGMLSQLGMAGNLGMISGLPMGASAMLPGGNYAALGAMLMQMMNATGASPLMGFAGGMPYANDPQQSFDDGGTIAEALQKAAKAIVAHVKK